ncbi:response regulator [Jeotgalibacillus sp. S-D1]|uniref:response regulator transcription factor n=1 Tax=Jeotgalibacillus sp. S-D1 TaxID=2552189 RepID=UPI00105A272C|nr:response regulator [Jeotgalibacillus sp. S-D1]TDL32772.1 response regulator [Jeotgalibacillus sp. S-D1]
MHKLLIVDDDWFISDSLRSMDEWLEMNVDVVSTAENGQEAIYWLENEGIDIVLTDIRMPHMDGLTLTKYIYENHPNTKVIIMSGYEDFSYAQKALRYNAKEYILKPIDTDELFNAIKKIQQENSKKSGTEIVEKNDSYNTHQERLIISSKSYINQNYMKPLSLKDLAERVHLSEHYFGQLFKTINGESFSAYITKVRMEKSCELLKNPILKNYEVSEMVGYIDSKHFTKIFKKTFGCTPKEYRNKLM